MVPARMRVTLRWKRHVAMLVTVPFFAAAGLVGLAAPATAATCHAGSCTGKGPVATGCDDDGTAIAEVPMTTGDGSTKVQLQYSQACKAMWARGRSLPKSDFDIRIVKHRTADDALLYSHRVTVFAGCSGCANPWGWTNMAGWTSGSKIRACIQQPVTLQWACTTWFRLA